MAKYVDGFVIPIKKTKLKAYKKMASVGAKVWMDHGALDYYECVGDDLKSPWGGIPFPKLCKLKANETVIFAFIVFESKAHRKRVNAAVHKDPRMDPEQFDNQMPMDMTRFTVGGFKVLMEGKAKGKRKR
jgi:uncharacterized protein YbaA (DUF1428 family)